MIYTCSHKNYNSIFYKTIAISGNKGKDAGYIGDYFPLLAPKKAFWTVWHNNIGKISEFENTKYYIKEYYKQVLSKLNPQEIYEKLDNSILLCYEDIDKFCHRHIVSAWFMLTLGIDVKEVKVNGNDIEFINVENYYKEILENVMTDINIKENDEDKRIKLVH